MAADALFKPFDYKGLHLKNRIVMAPMTRSFSPGGVVTDDVVSYYRRRAENEVGLIVSEGTGVDRPISVNDANVPRFHGDKALAGWQRVIDAVHEAGGAMAPQLWHVGAVRARDPEFPAGPYDSPSGLSRPDKQFGEGMTEEVVADTIAAFAKAAAEAKRMGYEAVELHGAHGYLLHEFLAPLSNHRTDSYGGTLENRARLLLQVVDAIRAEVGQAMPIAVRLSATEWVAGGFDIDETVTVVRWLGQHGADFVDISTGGNVKQAPIPVGPGYQVPYATAVKKATGVTTSTVGMIDSAFQAEQIVATGLADIVMVGREFLRDPSFALRAAETLQVAVGYIPAPYRRAYRR